MTAAPDLINLLCLDPRSSSSAFGGHHRFILIEKDFTNSGDFVFNNLLQNIARREPNTHALVVTLSHDWINYSAAAAKCGINLRKSQNGGNIDVLNVMAKVLDDAINNTSQTNGYCRYILEEVGRFVDEQTARVQLTSTTNPTPTTRPLVVMIDDLSILLALGADKSSVYRLVTDIDKILRTRSESLPSTCLSHLIVQSMFTNVKAKQSITPLDKDLNFLMSNLENICDLYLTLKPLETGHSTRVDGTIKIVDNRLPAQQAKSKSENKATPAPSLSMFSNSAVDIGSKKAYFYKLSDRRVRLTTSALIF